MHKTLIIAVVAVVVSSCAEQKCQEFDRADGAISSTKLGLGYEATLIVGTGEGPFQATQVPPGMVVDTSGGDIRVTGTPTEAGSYQLDIRPQTVACARDASTLVNLVVSITVAPAECDVALTCRLLDTGACTQSSTCVPSAGYVTAACIHSVGDAGVCVNVNAPADQCSGSIAAMTLTTVEGAEVESCVATPAIVGCNHHVCFGAP